MARGVPLLSLALALLLAGLLWSTQHGHSHSGTTAMRGIDQARQAAAAAALQQAVVALEQYHTLNGTYAGTSLAGVGVTLARADASSYCVQIANAHLAGPGGTAQPGAC
jgi:Tfp pilus assembly protein PilE